MPVNPAVIKKIVRENFNRSSDLYEQFEQKYGLFSYLTVKLAELCGIQRGMMVADIGCGTGTSSYALQRIVGVEGTIIGLDSSDKMLEIARAKSKDAGISNVNFISCDADGFDVHVDGKLDSVMYNATIFLIPEPQKTLKIAYETLIENGTVGMNYLIGLYGSDVENLDKKSPDTDLFHLAKQDGSKFAPYGRKITDGKILPGILTKIGFRNIREGILVNEMKLDEMKAFYSIPAQSAALWPRQEYEERLSLMDSLASYFQENGISTYYQHWGWCAAVKMK